MAAASYDQLLKQVEALKMENSNLRQELEDNSNHLTKLETEASNMKVLQVSVSVHVIAFNASFSPRIFLLCILQDFSVVVASYRSPHVIPLKENLTDHGY